MSKPLEVKARVTIEQKAALQRLADQKGEAISVILREAVNEFLARNPLPETPTRQVERPAPCPEEKPALTKKLTFVPNNRAPIAQPSNMSGGSTSSSKKRKPKPAAKK